MPDVNRPTGDTATLESSSAPDPQQARSEGQPSEARGRSDEQSGPMAVLYDAVHRATGDAGSPILPGDMDQVPRTFLGNVPLWGSDEAPTSETTHRVLEELRHHPSDSLAHLKDVVQQVSADTRPGLTTSHVGTVKQVGQSVASVWGLPQATTDGLLLFPNSVLGLVMNLDTTQVDCILLGPTEGIQGGDVVWASGQRLTVPVGDRLLGRIVSPLGEPLDGKGPLYVEERRFIEREAPGVVERQPVSEPLHTGVKAVDALIPIGRGQRELIIGDRQTGKTAIALDTIINQRDTEIICIYVCIGQRGSSVLQSVRVLEDAGAMEHTIVVVAAPDDPAALLYLAPYAGVTMAEWFMDLGRDVLIVYDDLTKHADAYREISLLLRRPPGREAYPGDVFYLHSRLLERAARMSDSEGGGSITAMPIVETRRGNISAYIPTNLISITDGQIYLDPELFNQNIKPAIDIGQSVSRVGSAAQTPIMRRVSGQLRLELSQYDEVAHFSRFGTEIDRTTRQQIIRGERLQQVLKQPPYAPLPLARQVVILTAVDLGYIDEIAIQDVPRYEVALWEYVERNAPRTLRAMEEERRMTSTLEQELRETIESFSKQFS